VLLDQVLVVVVVALREYCVCDRRRRLVPDPERPLEPVDND